MKHKKKFSLNDKLFWVGLGVLAIVGVVCFAAETSPKKGIFTTTYDFENKYKYKQSYNVDLKDIINETEATTITPGGEPVDSKLMIHNTGDIPMLVRIRYTSGFDDDGNPIGGMNMGDEYGTGETGGTWGSDGSIWDIYFAANNNFKLFRGDCYYYYCGMLRPDKEIQHLDSVALSTEESGADFKVTPWLDSDLTNSYRTDSADGSDGWQSGSSSEAVTGVKKEIKFGKSFKLAASIETVQAIDPTTGKVLTDDTLPTDEYDMYILWNNLLNPQTEESTAN